MSKSWYKYSRNQLVGTSSYLASKMVSAKFVIIACALLFVQAQAHPEPQVKSIITDLIKRLVPIVEGAIDRVFDTAGRIIGEASKDPIAYQKKTLDIFDKVLDKAFDGINEELDRIKARGSDNTVKYINCVEKAKVPIKNVFLDFYDSVTKCVAPGVNDLIKKLGDIFPALQEIKGRAFEAANNVQACRGTNAEEAQCLASVVEDILNSLRSTDGEVIQKALDIVLTIINNLEEHVPKCYKPSFEQAETDGVAALDIVTACGAA